MLKEHHHHHYVLHELDKQQHELEAERESAPIILGDHHDHHRAGATWGLMGWAALLVEFGFALYFFKTILNLSLWAAGALAIGLVALLALSLKLLLEFFYVKAQQAASAERGARHGH